MSPAEVLGPAASTFGVVLGVAPLAQMRLIVRRGSSEGVSFGYWAVLAVGMVLWLSYGLSIGNGWLILANSVSAAIAMVMLVVVWRYRPERT